MEFPRVNRRSFGLALAGLSVAPRFASGSRAAVVELFRPESPQRRKAWLAARGARGALLLEAAYGPYLPEIAAVTGVEFDPSPWLELRVERDTGFQPVKGLPVKVPQVKGNAWLIPWESLSVRERAWTEFYSENKRAAQLSYLAIYRPLTAAAAGL